ncbi:hypothetical protein chiPu_0025915, partial [Chiloscyllium punctatum]|nr:hypothetical protein [Chiloscyllium punctatum]
MPAPVPPIPLTPVAVRSVQSVLYVVVSVCDVPGLCRLLERHSEWEKQQDEERAQQRALRIQLSAMQLERTHTETEWNSLKEQNQRLDLQLAKLGSQCE